MINKKSRQKKVKITVVIFDGSIKVANICMAPLEYSALEFKTSNKSLSVCVIDVYEVRL